MREVVPFQYDITFKTNLASIVTISLEHEEVVKKGEIEGEFIVFGSYKSHIDTTDSSTFKYRIPYTTVIPDTLVLGSVSIAIENFTYEIVDAHTLQVHIDYVVKGHEGAHYGPSKKDVIDLEEEKERELEEREISEVESPELDILEIEIPEKDTEREEVVVASVKQQEEKKEVVAEQKNVEEQTEIVSVSDDEYITYKIHIVEEQETLEEIIKKEETNLDIIKIYNDVTSMKVGDKIIIPAYIDE